MRGRERIRNRWTLWFGVIAVLYHVIAFDESVTASWF